MYIGYWTLNNYYYGIEREIVRQRENEGGHGIERESVGQREYRWSWETEGEYKVQLTYDNTTDYNKTDGLSPTTRKMTGHNSRKTLSLRLPYTLPT